MDEFTLQKYRPYATDREFECLEAWVEHGSQKKAAAALKLTKRTMERTVKRVRDRAAKRGFSPEHDYTHPVPEGFLLRGESILYGKDGEPKLKWVKSAIDRDRQEELLREAIAGMSEDIPRAKPIKAPAHVDDDLCVIYPVGDHHVGMLSWHHETDADWDVDIAEETLKQATDFLMDAAPSAGTALVVFIGDFLHYDSFTPETPTSKNTLDSDTRAPKMVRKAVTAMRYTIEQAARKHKQVNVIVEFGNHDLMSTVWIQELLRNRYENDPRISIDTSPKHFHYFRFGQNIVGTHHGHGVKPEHLPLKMAADRPGDWGETIWRMWLTGHVHHRNKIEAVVAKDYVGCTVESLRILAPVDAWAAQHGYDAPRDMQAIVLHREDGELGRHTFKPRRRRK